MADLKRASLVKTDAGFDIQETSQAYSVSEKVTRTVLSLTADEMAELVADYGKVSPPATDAKGPAPTITSISPATASNRDPGFAMTVSGTGFVPASVVAVNGVAAKTTFGSRVSLSASVPMSPDVPLGPAKVTVVNPAADGGESAPAVLTVTKA